MISRVQEGISRTARPVVALHDGKNRIRGASEPVAPCMLARHRTGYHRPEVVFAHLAFFGEGFGEFFLSSYGAQFIAPHKRA